MSLNLLSFLRESCAGSLLGVLKVNKIERHPQNHNTYILDLGFDVESNAQVFEGQMTPAQLKQLANGWQVSVFWISQPGIIRLMSTSELEALGKVNFAQAVWLANQRNQSDDRISSVCIVNKGDKPRIANSVAIMAPQSYLTHPKQSSVLKDIFKITLLRFYVESAHDCMELSFALSKPGGEG